MQEGKALVEISVPAINKTYDVYIPLDCKMRDVLTLVSHTIKELSDGFFQSTPETIICDNKTGQIFDLNKFVVDLHIKNGSTMMLI